ncbi:hypothetical protein STEG23_035084 [Scotinomys teguina]
MVAVKLDSSGRGDEEDMEGQTECTHMAVHNLHSTSSRDLMPSSGLHRFPSKGNPVITELTVCSIPLDQAGGDSQSLGKFGLILYTDFCYKAFADLSQNHSVWAGLKLKLNNGLNLEWSEYVVYMHITFLDVFDSIYNALFVSHETLKPRLARTHYEAQVNSNSCC